MALHAERHGNRVRFYRKTKRKKLPAWPTQRYANEAWADMAVCLYRRTGVVLALDENRRVASDDAAWFMTERECDNTKCLTFS